MLIQWGTYYFDADNRKIFFFPTSFSSTNYFLVGSWKINADDVPESKRKDGPLNFGRLKKDSFQSTSASNLSHQYISIIAIGY